MPLDPSARHIVIDATENGAAINSRLNRPFIHTLASSCTDFGGIGSQRRKLSKRASSSGGAARCAPEVSILPWSSTIEPTSSPFYHRLKALPSV